MSSDRMADGEAELSVAVRRIAEILERMDERARHDTWPENCYRGAVVLATIIVACAFWFSPWTASFVAPPGTEARALREIAISRRPKLVVVAVAIDGISVRFDVRNRGSGEGRYVRVDRLRLVLPKASTEAVKSCPVPSEPYVAGTTRPGPTIEAGGKLEISATLPKVAGNEGEAPFSMVGGLEYLSEIEARWVCIPFVLPGYRPALGEDGAVNSPLVARPE